MSSVNLTEQQQVIYKLLTYIKAIPDLPVGIALEAHPADESMMLQQLAGAVKINEDMIGGYTAQIPFALYYRTLADDTLSRVKATGALNNIGRYFEQQTHLNALPTLDINRTATRIEMRNTPSMVSKLDNGAEVYQAIYMLEYEQERII